MSTEPKFTPGPWRDNPDGKHHELVGDGMWFAKLRWTVTGPRNSADARLIAAAPDLYAALRNIYEGNLGDEPWQANYDKIRAVARAALSKATAVGHSNLQGAA
ncbi:MAG: hypothetical protein EOR57_31425 [Mesorhizobium sp.]|uniref:hypothetical protein n=1 Tax=Mesorhizobium sp. TaxID=1871066 RepID=UPI000FE6A4C0|nr:hypothetical protein [Mesorhizobium sp.]RWL14858.1 MAG: hypothetical protein EOR57_31425 [Mesorhizobium sp.]